MGKKIVIELDIEQGAAIRDLDAVKKGFEKVIDEQDKQIEATKESTKASEDLGNKLDGVTGGAVTKFKSLVGGIKNSVTSLKAMRVALIATGIGAFVVAIGTLVANLQNSEEGFNRVNKLMKQLGVVAGNVTDIFYNLGTALFALLSGDMDLMNESFEKATNQIKNFGEETKREIALQGELSDKQAELVKIERSLILQRAEANRDRADLLEKAADRENYTASQRVAFLKEAGRIEEEITNAEIKAAQLRLEIKEQSNSLSESSTEDLNEQKQLEADIIDLQTAKLTKQKEVTSQIIGALNEERAAEKLALQERQSEIFGCMDENATNFNENANNDNGSCVYDVKTGDKLGRIRTLHSEIKDSFSGDPRKSMFDKVVTKYCDRAERLNDKVTSGSGDDSTCRGFSNAKALATVYCKQGDKIKTDTMLCTKETDSLGPTLYDELAAKYCDANPDDPFCGCYNVVTNKCKGEEIDKEIKKLEDTRKPIEGVRYVWFGFDNRQDYLNITQIEVFLS